MRTVIAIALLAATALSGCSGNSTNVNGNSNVNANKSTINVNPEPPKIDRQPDPGYVSCNTYFPLKPGSRYIYEVTYPTGLVVTATVVVDEMEENGRKVFVEKIHMIDQQTKGIEYIQNWERRFVCDGERVQLFYENTITKAKENRSIATFNYKPDTVFMPDTASLSRPGFNWTMSFTSTMTSEGQMPTTDNQVTAVEASVMGEEEVTLPVGRFKAVKIRKTVNEVQVYESYVKELGLVQRESSQGLFWKLSSYSGLNPAQAR